MKPFITLSWCPVGHRRKRGHHGCISGRERSLGRFTKGGRVFVGAHCFRRIIGLFVGSRPRHDATGLLGLGKRTHAAKCWNEPVVEDTSRLLHRRLDLLIGDDNVAGRVYEAELTKSVPVLDYSFETTDYSFETAFDHSPVHNIHAQ